jgi:hypothetical protein
VGRVVAVGRILVRVESSPLPPRELGAGSWAWIYFGNEAARYLRVRGLLESHAREIPAGPLLNEVIDVFREEIINFDDALEIKNELHWQATDVAEHNLFSFSYVHACCSLLVLNRLARELDSDLLVVADDVFLARQLAGLARALDRDCRGLRARVVDAARYLRACAWLVPSGARRRVFFLRELVAMRRELRRLLDPARRLDPVDAVVVTWTEPDTFDPERPIDSETFFGSLPGALRQAGHRVGYLANLTRWVHPLEALLRNIGAARDPVVVPEEALRWRDALRIILGTVAAPARPRRRFVIDGVDLTSLIIDELRQERAKTRQLWALQFFYAGRLLAHRFRPKTLLVLFENQPWEKMLQLGIRAALPEVDIIGCQHTPNSVRWLPFFPSRRDLRAGRLPDRVFVIGALWERIFAAHGYPPERLHVVPALRFGHVLARGVARAGAPSPKGADADTDTVLVAASIGPSDSLELIAKAVLALESMREIRILVKLHPKMGGARESFMESLRRALGRASLPGVTFVDAPITELLSRARVLLYNSTSVSYEALAADVPIVFVRSDFWFDVDPIPAGAGVGLAARTPAEIRAAVEELLREDPAKAMARRERSRALLADAFAPGTADDFAKLVF